MSSPESVLLHTEAPRRQPSCGSLRKPKQMMARERSKTQEDVRFRVLRLLEGNPEMSQRALAEAVVISSGGTHYVLSALIEKGLIKLGNFSASEDKRRDAYILTPTGLAEKAAITKRFLARKIEEYEALKAEIEELQDEIDHDAQGDQLPNRGSYRPTDRQRASALERFVIGWPISGLVGWRGRSAHASQLPRWIHEMNPSPGLCNRAD
jgi:EPS-associated MarR family transcriptional regulator